MFHALTIILPMIEINNIQLNIAKLVACFTVKKDPSNSEDALGCGVPLNNSYECCSFPVSGDPVK